MEDPPDDSDGPAADISAVEGSDEKIDLSIDEDQIDQNDSAEGVDAEENGQEAETLPGGNDAGTNDQKKGQQQEERPKGAKASGFVGLDDDELEAMPAAESIRKAKEKLNQKKARNKTDKAAAEKSKNKEPLPEKTPEKADKKASAKVSEPKKSVGRLSPVYLIFCVVPAAMIAAGGVLYYKPTLVGLTRVKRSTPVSPVEVVEPVTPAPKSVEIPPVSSRHEMCIAKIDEAARLRQELLEKKNEIYELDLYYHNGITELENEISRTIENAGIKSFEAAIKNKRIELNLRTIQRRGAYINELVKPASWLNQGSEELLYLMRKAELDLQLNDMAGGIELNKHMRHISAAIQKYRPGPEKLAVNPLQAKVEPLDKIWEGIRKKKEYSDQVSLNPKNETITSQICTGNFERIAEMTHISPRAAECLSRMKGSDLFLNGVTTLEPEVAKQLFQWQGNWICLNGVKRISPAAAQHLFRWKGNWISLNNLAEFPPELAKHLLKWEGRQLELMGLKCDQDEAGKKTLKYLALWETTGGKLFVTDKIRKEIDSLM